MPMRPMKNKRLSVSSARPGRSVRDGHPVEHGAAVLMTVLSGGLGVGCGE